MPQITQLQRDLLALVGRGDIDKLSEAQLNQTAGTLGVTPEAVREAVAELARSGFSDQAAAGEALSGQSASPPASVPAGELGWNAQEASAAANPLVGGSKSLISFMLDIGDAGHATADEQSTLVDYAMSFVADRTGAEAAARLMIHAETTDTAAEPALLRAARPFLDQLGQLAGSLAERIATASKQQLGLKAQALGKRFYQEGTFKQLKEPEIRHRELRDSPVSTPEIEALDAELATAGARAERVRELYGQLLQAGQLASP